MSGHCKDCRYWFPVPEEEATGTCWWTVTSNGVAEQRESLAWAYDSQEDNAYLVTGENFGCVQWASKTEAVA